MHFYCSFSSGIMAVKGLNTSSWRHKILTEIITNNKWLHHFILPCFFVLRCIYIWWWMDTPSPISLMVSVDVKQHWINDEWFDKNMPMLHVIIFDWILRLNTGMSEMSYLGQFYSWKRKGIKWCIWFQF